MGEHGGHLEVNHAKQNGPPTQVDGLGQRPTNGRAGICWRRWSTEVSASVYPHCCWICRTAADNDGACAEHRLELGFRDSRCRRCLGLLGRGVKADALCANCRRTSPSYGRIFALGPYRAGEGLANWILALKYGGRPDLAEPLGLLLAGLIPVDLAGGPRGILVVPVPLHRVRRLERRYDQAELLAVSVAEHSGLVFGRALRRTRWTAPQGSAQGRSRSANVKGAFRLRSAAEQQLARRVVLLVDDVSTSGSTLSACAKVLRAGGAAGVVGLVLARGGAAQDSSAE
ncbi:MAG: ComF family protein [Planctomycetota bacterium]